MSPEKICTKCKVPKPLTQFYTVNSKHLSRCKECDYLYYKRPNALKRLAKAGKTPRGMMTLKSEEQKKIEARERSRRYKVANRDRINANKRRRRAEKALAKPPKLKVDKPLKIKKPRLTAEQLKINRKESKRLYRLKYPEKVQAERERYKARAKQRPEKVVARSLRRRLRKLLKHNYKSGTYVRTLGCTSLELKAHLESQFAQGMTWENYGTRWHIDHIRPLCSFDLLNDDELKEAANFKNLQPLWAEDNLKKGGKW